MGFHLTFKTADLQDIIYTTYGDGIKITFINLNFFIPIFIQSADTQAMFKESINNKYTISFDSWYTDRKVVIEGFVSS